MRLTRVLPFATSPAKTNAADARRSLAIIGAPLSGRPPRTMALDSEGKAYPLSPTCEWSPADGDFVRHCPTAAITVRRLDIEDEHAAETLDVPKAPSPAEAA